jgi:citrate lyase subunit beta-like protein
MDLKQICEASPLLSGLVFAAEDFALDLSLTRTPALKEFMYARSAIAVACRAHNLPSTIDLVCTEFRGEEGRRLMERESEEGKGLGFNGKQCIHPAQAEIAQRIFQASEKELEWAVRVAVADIQAEKQGRGAWALDGKMIDVPVKSRQSQVACRESKALRVGCQCAAGEMEGPAARVERQMSRASLRHSAVLLLLFSELLYE